MQVINMMAFYKSGGFQVGFLSSSFPTLSRN
jgi:hypothetical protein